MEDQTVYDGNYYGMPSISPSLTEVPQKPTNVGVEGLRLRSTSNLSGIPINNLNGPSNSPQPVPASAGAAAIPTRSNGAEETKEDEGGYWGWLPGQGPPEPHRTTVRILFIRHSESCANLLKKMGRKMDQARYTDPELTVRGVRMAQERGGELTKLVPRVLGTEVQGPLYYGASILRRTQQTAAGLLAGGAPPAVDDSIYVLPYVSEVGLGYDNTPGVRETRNGVVSFERFDEMGPDAKKPDVAKFFAWLGSQTRKPGFLGSSLGPRAPEIRMVIVSHAGWMEAMAKSISATVPRYENLDAAGVEIRFGDDGAIISRPTWIDSRTNPTSHLQYSGIALTEQACPDNCSGAQICSGQTGPVCGRLQAIYDATLRADPIPWATVIGPLAQDMAVESLYATGERQKALQDAVALLKKYAPSVGFGRTRERRYLLGDVRGIMTDISCEGVPTGTSDACQSLGELLATPEEGVNAIPNWKLSLAANRMMNPQNQKLLRNYAKPAGWFTRKKKRKEGALRRNLEQMQAKLGCPQSLVSHAVRRNGSIVPVVAQQPTPTGDPRAPTITTVPTTASNPPIPVSNSSNSNSNSSNSNSNSSNSNSNSEENPNTLQWYGPTGPRRTTGRVAPPASNRPNVRIAGQLAELNRLGLGGGARRTRKSRRGKKRQTRRRR